jgi:predicted deacylase
VFGAPGSPVRAAADGVLWRTRRLPQVATGEYVCSVGTDVDDY